MLYTKNKVINKETLYEKVEEFRGSTKTAFLCYNFNEIAKVPLLI